MIFCILGQSSSGKNEIFKRLRNHPSLTPIITTTSRPMREHEKQHIDYHFITKDEFINAIHNNEFMEYTTYHVASNDTWYYGTKWNEFEDDTHKVIIVNPQGFSSIVNTYGNSNVIGIVVNRDLRSRALSYLQRDEKSDYNEMVRRFKQDEKDFTILNGLHFSNIHHVQNVDGDFGKCLTTIEKIIGGYTND